MTLAGASSTGVAEVLHMRKDLVALVIFTLAVLIGCTVQREVVDASLANKQTQRLTVSDAANKEGGKGEIEYTRQLIQTH